MDWHPYSNYMDAFFKKRKMSLILKLAYHLTRPFSFGLLTPEPEFSAKKTATNIELTTLFKQADDLLVQPFLDTQILWFYYTKSLLLNYDWAKSWLNKIKRVMLSSRENKEKNMIQNQSKIFLTKKIMIEAQKNL